MFEEPKIKLTIPCSNLSIGAYEMEQNQLLLATQEVMYVIDISNWTCVRDLRHYKLLHPDFKGRLTYSCMPDYNRNFLNSGQGFLCSFDNS